MTLTIEQQAEKAVATAKVALLTRREFVFFSSVLLKLELKFTDTIKTAATNGKQLLFNPNFVMGLPHRQRVFLLMHELYHVIYKHVTRCGDRDHKLWNVATDYVINNELDHQKFDVIPGGLLDHQYDGMPADVVYTKLVEDEKNNPGSTPQPDHDDLMPGISDPNGTEAAIDKHIGEAMIRVEQERRSGTKVHVPDSVQRYYDELLAPKVEWQVVLQEFLYGVAKNDYTWARPSRRSHVVGLYLPTIKGDTMDCLDFAIDTSGSVSEEDFRQFISEIHKIFQTFNPENIGIIQFDDSIRCDRRVCSLDEFEQIEFKGGGGTDIEPVLANFDNSEGKALVVLTDGFFYHDIKMEPRKPVIWAIYNNPHFVPAFGKAVHFNL